MIKTFLFDLGNVLVAFDHRIAACRMAKFSPLNEDGIYQLFFDSKITCDFEEGRILPEEFFRHAREMTQADITYEQFLPVWNEIFWDIPETQALLRNLKKHYIIGMISNLNILHYEYLRKTSPIISEIPIQILSYEVGYRKPHPAIYEAALEKTASRPQEVIYIDDRGDLVEAAVKLGFNAVHFKDKNFAQLLADIHPFIPAQKGIKTVFEI